MKCRDESEKQVDTEAKVREAGTYKTALAFIRCRRERCAQTPEQDLYGASIRLVDL